MPCRERDKPFRPKKASALDASERLRNLYRSEDETGRRKPDNGETFAGLVRKKRHEEPDK